MTSVGSLEKKARWVRRETLKLHKRAPESRVASSLSMVEIFVSLYYGGAMQFDATDTFSSMRDRLIISKGHGAVSLYPILADLGFLDRKNLDTINEPGALLRAIPDMTIPGFETINGALGHGLGIACGVAMAMRLRNTDRRVFVICGDGELNEGSVWEAAMFAGYHKLDNLILIVDCNQMSMLGYTKEILDLQPLSQKLEAFGWLSGRTDGHDIEQLCDILHQMKNSTENKPKALIARTVKGRGVPQLEGDPLCHVKSLRPEEVDALLEEHA